MIEAYHLYLVLIVLYFWESLLRITSRELLLWRGWSGWLNPIHDRASDSLYRTSRGSYIPGGLFPPFGESFILPLPLIACCNMGIIGNSGFTISKRRTLSVRIPYMGWDDFQSIASVDGSLKINGNTFLSKLSEKSSTILEQRLLKLARLSPENRITEIENEVSLMRDLQMLEEARKRLSRFRMWSIPLRLIGSLLFLYLFVGLPIMLYLTSIERTWLSLLILLISLALIQSMIYALAHSRLYPETPWNGIGEAMLMILSPPLAIRAVDHLSSPLFSDTPFFIALRVLLPVSSMRNFLLTLQRDLLYPVADDSENPEVQSCLRETRSRWMELIQKLSMDLGFHIPEEALNPPERRSIDKSYCPRCHHTYVISEGVCNDCRIPLVRFAD